MKHIQLNPNTFRIIERGEQSSNNSDFTFSVRNQPVFQELINSKDLLEGQYDVLSGKMPENYNEVVLIVNEKNQIPASLMYSLNIEDRKEVKEIVDKKLKGEEISLESISYSYEDIVGKTFKLLLNTDYYEKENGIWINKMEVESYKKTILQNAEELTIVGVLRVSKDAVEADSGYIGYTHNLMEYVIEKIKETPLAKEQIENHDMDIINQIPFTDTYTYEMALETLGVFDIDNPSTILIYPKDYEAKEEVIKIIDEYNKEKEEKDKITYTDYVGTLMSGITTIINVITYVLIAFVAISLVVSSIMISIITYISVLERTKEIGILRAIGASKKDVRRVFNAETIIEGFISGTFGILVTVLFCFPINRIVEMITNVSGVAKLPFIGGFLLIIISIFLTLIAGLVPSSIASKKDPVESLRTE